MWIDTLPEEYRVRDEVMAAAYEATGDQGRAWLKTTMALVRARFGESAEYKQVRERPAGSGFEMVRTDRPVDWVVVLVDEDFHAATRLCAAVMVARLAGARRTVALLQGEPAPAILTALELLGVEDIFALDLNQMRKTLLQAKQEPQGRMLCFGQSISLGVPEGLRIPARADRPPRILLGPDTTPENQDVIRRAHPDSVFVDSRPDVEYTSTDDGTDSHTQNTGDCGPLRLHPELCGAWLYPHLTPAFFTVSRIDLSPAPNNEN